MDAHEVAVVLDRSSVADKGPDCERVGAKHWWYNRDNATSGCYHCKVVRDGRFWEEY
jgi:hypothetical protein